jgi:hypothetical protein
MKRLLPAVTGAAARRVAAAAFLFAALPVLAHHGVARYDMRVVATLYGVVERWGWQSPHTSLTLAVERDGGTEIWEIEGAPPGWMSRQGWSPESLAAGEAVTITYHPVRQQPARAGILMEVARADGEVLKVNRPARLGGP